MDSDHRKDDSGWTASTDVNLDYYELRISAGPKFKGADLTLLATLAPGNTTYKTHSQFLQTRATLYAIVDVVLDDVHEKQSDTVLAAPF